MRTHAADTFSKTPSARPRQNSAGASLLLSVHGNSDPYSSDSYGLECYPQPPGAPHHEDSLRLAHLIADKFAAGQKRLRGNAGVRYIYYAGDDESGYEKQVVVEESDLFRLLRADLWPFGKTDCPAVLVEQCFVTSEADVAPGNGRRQLQAQPGCITKPFVNISAPSRCQDMMQKPRCEQRGLCPNDQTVSRVLY